MTEQTRKKLKLVEYAADAGRSLGVPPEGCEDVIDLATSPMFRQQTLRFVLAGKRLKNLGDGDPRLEKKVEKVARLDSRLTRLADQAGYGSDVLCAAVNLTLDPRAIRPLKIVTTRRR